MRVLLTTLHLHFWFRLVSASSLSSIHLLSFAPPAPPTKSVPATSGLDPAIIVALISLAGVIASTLITVYQNRHHAKLEQKRHEERLQQDREIVRLQRELESQLKREQRDQELQEQTEQAARAAMLLAKNREEQVTAYRRALHADPRIARLQILEMTRPLEVADIYVRLRLHEEMRASYRLDVDLPDGEQESDPNALLKEAQHHLEQRAATALTPEETLRKYRRCVIVGDPGAGKSTLLKHLALHAIEGRLPNLPDLPIHLELQTFSTSGHRDVLEWTSSQWEERYGFPRADALEHLQGVLQAGHAVLLLDALDETVTGENRTLAEESYRRVCEAITNLATRYPLAPIVVTARKAGYHQRARLAGFTEVEVLDFRQEDIVQFVHGWFATHPQEQKRGNAPDLIARLERNPRMQALAANPLLLSLIALVYEDQLDLPERRAELYKQCVDTLLTKWDASRNIRRVRAFKPEHKRQLLEEIAWHFHLQGQRYFPEPELLGQIATFLPAVGLAPEHNSQVLAEIAAENGLLKEQAHGWHGFLHLTLQEYFVAQYAVDHQQAETLLARRENPWWEEVFLLYAGRIPDASALLQGLLEGEPSQPSIRREDLFHTDLLLAGRCLAASPTLRHHALRQDILTRLFTVLRTSPYTLMQAHTARTLAEIGGTAVAPRLVELLANEQVHWRVRESIAQALGALGECSVAPRLIELLVNEQVHWRVRESIAQALGALGERSVAPRLVELLANEQMHWRVRESIAQALGALGECSVAPRLVELLANEQTDWEVRESIAQALGALGERSVAPRLVELLTSEQTDWGMRRSIAQVLGALGERSVVPRLIELLANEQMDSGVRKSIAQALGALEGRSVVPRLIELLANEQTDWEVRESIAQALGALGERSVAPRLVELLANEQMHSEVRESIAQALGALGECSVTPRLIELLANEQVRWGVRESIAQVLGALGERSVVPRLVELLANEQVHSGVRRSIAQALGALGEQTVAPRLIELLANEQVDWGVRESIPWALGALGERSVVPRLVELLAKAWVHPDVRRRIADIFPTLVTSEEQVRPLAALLPTSDIANDIYRALWAASRQLHLRIFVYNTPEGTHLEVVQHAPEKQQ